MGLKDSIAPVMVIAAFLVSLMVMPVFCNSVLAGSSVDMSSGSVTTSTSSNQAGLNYNIRVVDTVGKVSAYIEGTSMEGRGDDSQLGGVVKFRETTSVDGYIALFDKTMKWEFRNTR